MSSLYIRVRTGFYSHKKTIRLKLKLGMDALWIPPRLWAWAAESQPDGDLSGYSSEEIAELIGFFGNAKCNAQAMLQALKDSGFVDESGMIHDWGEHNGYHETFSIRAKKAAEARWSKENPPTPPKEEIGKGKGKGKGEKHCLTNATSIYSPESRVALHWLNEKSGKHFRECESSLAPINARLQEPGVDIEGVKKMIERQCLRWLGTEQADYLRPETLFGKQKFDGYYAAKDMPLSNGKNKKLTGDEKF